MNEKISVIIPVYNCEKYLNKCVDSVLNQTYTNYEIILIDDGSTDRSSEICDKYEKVSKKVKVLHQKNSGVSQARNNGVDIAEGKYICFLDSDDYIEKEYFKFAIEKMQKV